MNPFERKFKEFAKNLSTQNAESHTQHIAAQSGEVFRDKPFSEEFQTVYKIAGWGQSVAQVVTFSTTAALGVFALTHIIPLWWGIYVAVPLGILFAFGVERTKRSTLAIASKHLLKYKTFGFVGFVALLVMLVSIGAALWGAKELPAIVYAKPDRQMDSSNVEALNADIDQVQADISRLQDNLKKRANWVAENRTLPKLQAQRAALIEKREAATQDATTQGEQIYSEALADRQANIEKMQVYSVGAAIVAELIFLLCTGFILYYLFRHFAESNPEPERDTEQLKTMNGQTAGKSFAHNLRTAPDNVSYTIPADYARATTFVENDKTIIVNGANSRICEHCKTPYIYKHAKQKFCSEKCRIESWEAANGRKMNRGKPVNPT